jgi:hypothetical protein
MKNFYAYLNCQRIHISVYFKSDSDTYFYQALLVSAIYYYYIIRIFIFKFVVLEPLPVFMTPVYCQFSEWTLESLFFAYP